MYNNLIVNISKFFFLKNKLTILIVFFSLLISLISVKFLSFNKLIKVTQNFVNKKNKKKLSSTDIISISRVEQKLSSLLNIDQCLVRSIALFFILNNYGYKPKLIIGADNKDNKFYSHSWIEVDNFILYEDSNRKFKNFFEIG